VSRTQNLCPQQMLHARANGETFVSATMCPRLPGPVMIALAGFWEGAQATATGNRD